MPTRTVKWQETPFSSACGGYLWEAEGGMVLKQKWVDGKPYWDSALRILDKMMPELLDAKLQEWLDNYF